MIEHAIQKISSGQDLSQQESYETITEIVSGQASDVQIAALLTGLRVKGETVDEIAGGVQSLLEAANRIHPNVPSTVDTVGTGGDKTGTFNISSASALVASGAGACMAKHGNRSVSSKCGSADVFEALGLDLALTPEEAERCIEQHGFAFLFAPVYHPAMRYAAPVRRELGIRSLFNLLGPLANPAGASHMLVGVCDAGLLGFMAKTLKKLGAASAMVVSGRDRTDEISLSGPTDYCELKDGHVSSGVIEPELFGIQTAPLSAIQGGTPQENARIIEDILGGMTGPYRDIVLLNAGATLYVADKAQTIAGGIDMARHAIDSGAARQKLIDLRSVRGQKSREENA